MNKKLENNMIILCGGRGRRLGKLTNQIPKPMVKIGNASIIEHKLKYYRSQGLKKFIFCLGYKGDLLKKFLQKNNTNAVFHNGGIAAGILKRIFFIRKYLKKDTLISYGDTLAKIDFKKLLLNHKKSRCPLTIVVAPIKNPFGLVAWDKKNKIKSFEEKPILNHFIGYAVISPNFFDKINNKIVNLKDGMGIVESIKFLIKKRKANVYKYKGLQLTINSEEELNNVKLNYTKYFTLDEKFKK